MGNTRRPATQTLPWRDLRCIVCLRADKSLTVSHVIPDALGGFLACRNSCKDCNSSTGTAIEAHAREDPVIRRTSEELRDQIPDLATAIRVRQGSTSVDEEGRVIPWLHRADGTVMPDQRPQAESWTFEADGNGAPRLRRFFEDEVARGEVTTKELDRAAAELDAGAGEVRVGRVGIFRSGSTGGEIELTPTLDGPVLDARVPLAITYGYLAIILEDEIYDAKFDPTRDVLNLRVPGASIACRVSPIDVKWLPEPRHAIIGRSSHPIVVDIRLFRCVGWRVELPGVSTEVELPAIFLDIITGRATYE